MSFHGPRMDVCEYCGGECTEEQEDKVMPTECPGCGLMVCRECLEDHAENGCGNEEGW
jgi:hypothetical protein